MENQQDVGSGTHEVAVDVYVSRENARFELCMNINNTAADLRGKRMHVFNIIRSERILL